MTKLLSSVLDDATKIMEQSIEELHPVSALTALSCMKDCYQVAVKQLGPCHKLTLTAQHRLTICLYQAGQLDDAIVMAKRCLLLREDCHFMDTEDIFATRRQLTIYLDKKGRTNEAIPIEEMSSPEVSSPEEMCCSKNKK